MLLKFVLVVVIFLSYEVLAYRGSRSHRWPSSPHWSRRVQRKRLYRIPTKMPSGTIYNITVPTTETKISKCPMTSSLIDLNPNGKMGKIEYNIVKNETENTWSGGFTGHQIVKIQKISNPCLWKRYKFSKDTVSQEASSANEHMLFHGSAAALQLVDSGFDERYANIFGLLGAGIYFADSGSKSNMYNAGSIVNGTKLLLLCRVTLGTVCAQNTVNRLPHAPAGCHSVTGNFGLPEYVVYRGEQAYPEYLITYS